VVAQNPPGSVGGDRLQDDFNESAFRFNHRRSRRPGKLFYRRAQQAVAIEPTTYRKIVDLARNRDNYNHNLLG
jgi:hypothetical protein